MEKMILPMLSSKKEENHQTLCEEILRERAAVLSRAGRAVEEIIGELSKLDQQIQIKSNFLETLKQQNQDQESLNLQQVLIAEINNSINQFNSVWSLAQLKYYYLIVTREALGLRRHDRIKEVYPIPAKKKQIQAA